MKIRRKLTQLITAVLYNCHFTGFINGSIYKGKTKGICTPGLNCYSCPGAAAACPLGSLQGAITKSRYNFPFYILGVLLLSGIVLGRTICGFFCPFGLFQELIYKLPTPKIKKSALTGKLSYVKYVILIVFAVFIPFFTMDPGFCKFICPAGTLEAGIPLFFLNENIRKSVGVLFSWKVILALICILLCVFLFRAFCRFLCPLGAIYSLFNPAAFFGIKTDKEKCTNCGACVSYCKVDIRHPGDKECIQCMECSKICPEGAIGNEICYNTRGIVVSGTQTDRKDNIS